LAAPALELGFEDTVFRGNGVALIA
jgi:hypothetical protein